VEHRTVTFGYKLALVYDHDHRPALRINFCAPVQQWVIAVRNRRQPSNLADSFLGVGSVSLLSSEQRNGQGHRSGIAGCGKESATYGRQKDRAWSVHLPKPTATMLAITRQTYTFCAGSLFGPAW